MEQWKCPYCMSISRTEQGHWQHLKDAHNDSTGYEAWKTKKKGNEGLICPHCSATSKTEQGLWQHCKDVHNDSKGYEAWKTKKNGIIEGTNLFTCPHCPATSKTEQGNWQHCKDVHNDSTGYEAWKTKKNGTIEGTNLFSCPHCSLTSKNEQGHWQHQSDSHGDKEGYNAWVKRKREASRDIKKEAAKIEKKEVCPIEDCTGIFPHLAALAQHTKDVHGVFLIEQDSLFNPEEDEHSIKNLFEFKQEVMDLKEKLNKLGRANTIEEFKIEQQDSHFIAWKGLLLIESILRLIARILNFDKPGGTWGNYLSYLKLIGFIQPDLYSTLWDLKMLRNVISHSDDVLVNRRKTEVILKTSQDILSVIENYNLNKSI